MTDFFENLEDELEEQAAAEEEESSAEVVDMVEGQTLKGIFLKATTPVTQYGQALLLIIKDIERDETVKLWCPTMLRSRIEDPEGGQPKPGKGIGIRYDGLRDTRDGSNQYKSFTLTVEESDPAYWNSIINPGWKGEQTGRGEVVKTEEPEGGWF